MTERYLIVGLGNPGRRYKSHRHNVGFMLLDRLAKDRELAFSRIQHRALVATGRIAQRSIILAKPQTFMNACGQSVSRMVRFFKTELDHLLVVYDDLDLPLGTLRIRASGGSGGHRGMVDILKRLGSQDFPRLRLGIGRPPGVMDPADYVLRPFRAQEKELLDIMLAEGVCAVETFLCQGIELAMSRHNRATGANDIFGREKQISLASDGCIEENENHSQ